MRLARNLCSFRNKCPPVNPKYLPHIGLLVCNVIWAMDYPFYRLILPRDISPLALSTSVLAVAALLSLATLPFMPPERVERRDIFRFLGAGLLMGVLHKLFLMNGMARTSPIDGSIIDTVGPVLVLIVSVAMGIDRFTPMKLVGIILGMGGALLVILSGASPSHAASDLTGNILVFLCAFTTALYMVWFKRLISKYRTITVLRWLYCSAAVMILPFGFGAVIHTDYSAMATGPLLAWLFVLTVPTFVPNYLLAYSLKHVSPTVSSIYTYLQPVVATAVAVAMGMDRPRWDSVLAAAVIFLGVWFVIRSYRSNAAAPPLHNR